MSSLNSRLQGVLPVPQTPSSAGETIDVPALHRQIDWALETGADGIAVALASEILRLGDDRFFKRLQLAIGRTDSHLVESRIT